MTIVCLICFSDYHREGSSAMSVLQSAVQCALRKNCIAPPGATAANHRYGETESNASFLRPNPIRFDQSVFSILIHQAKLRIEKDVKYWANYGNTLNKFHETVLYSRRFQYPKAYVNYLRMKALLYVIVVTNVCYRKDM